MPRFLTAFMHMITGLSSAPPPEASKATSGLVNGDMVLTVIVWLCVISFILLLLLILVLVQHCQQKAIEEDYTNTLHDLYRFVDEQTPSQSPNLPTNDYVKGVGSSTDSFMHKL